MPTQPKSPQAMYRAEKERALRERSLNHSELMAEAQRAFTKMMEDGKWTDSMSPFGIPKTRVQKIVLKKKAKTEKAEGDAAAPGATPAAGAAAGTKPAAGAAKK